MKTHFQSLVAKTLIGTAATIASLCAFNAPGLLPAAHASSHSDAPLIKLDPQANLTDVYAFVGTRGEGAQAVSVLNVIVHVHPFCEPGDGVIYDKMSDDAIYSIHLADPNTGQTLTRYDFKYTGPTEGLKNPNTILSYGLGTEVGAISTLDDARRNYTQRYSVTKVVGGVSTVLGINRKTAPPNVGLRVTPAYNDPTTGFAVSGTRRAAYMDTYTRQAIYNYDSGESTFSGPREDGFYADTPGIFNLLDPRILDNDGTLGNHGGLGQDGGGVDGFKGYNTEVYAIQIPLTDLPKITYTAPFFGQKKGVGVYASVSRPRVSLLSATGAPTGSEDYVQVNRLGNPLFNEVLVPLKDKDNYNRDNPTSDATKYATYAQNPEVAALINTVYGTSFATSGRADLKAVYIPDVLKVDLETGPVRLPGETGYSRFGFIGGDTTASGNSSGWPNGRRLGDDVVDIALTAVASGPDYSAITLVGDNIATNDQVYNRVFPYSATPNSGARNRKDSY